MNSSVLYLIATPIGNLSDISLRALEVLQSVDYILCEDTRTSHILLNRHHIHKPLHSHHKFNEKATLEKILRDLEKGLNIALITDAGTPGICDPGTMLIAYCYEKRIPFTAIPGACALVMALTLSGFSTERFQFIGFLPKSKAELQKCLATAFHYPGTTICYETPHHLLDTLKLFPEQKNLCIVREMTKIYEEALRGTAKELSEHFQKCPLKGEIVLLFEGSSFDFNSLSPQEHVALLQSEYGLSLQEAIKLAAHLRGIPKRDLYGTIHGIFKIK